MKILSLSLENIKSYVKETITFYDGVNFISGPNGAGKSTIIESIGYALFDSNPFSATRHFIREGEKSGTISVVFEARDERLYKAERRLRQPSGGSWTIYDLESETELSELHGSQDIKCWLAENLGVTGELDPAMLFEDVIGVSQGKFTTPFLERGVRRKDIFNAILQLETYRQAFEKSSKLTGVLGQRAAEIKGECRRLLDKAEDLEQCRSDFLAAEQKSQDLCKETAQLNSKLLEVEKSISYQESKKEQLDTQEKRLQEAGIRLENLQLNIDRMQNELKTAKAAGEKLTAAEPGYREYLLLSSETKTLELRRKERDSYQQRSQVILNNICALEAEIKSDEENRTRQAALYETEKEELLNSGKETAHLKAEAEKCLQAKKEQWKDYEDYIRPLRQLENVLQKYRISGPALKNIYKNWFGVTEEAEGLLKELARFELAESQVREAVTLERDAALVQEELSTVKARLKTLNENLLDAAGGLCPFLQTACSNIEGSLEEYFQKEIKLLTPSIKELQARKENLDIRLMEVRRAQQEIQTLQVKRGQYDNLKTREKLLHEELIKAREGLLNDFGPQAMSDLSAGLESIRSLWAALKGFEKSVSNLDKENSSIDELIKEYISVYQAHTDLSSPEFDKAVSYLASLIETLKDSVLSVIGPVEKSVQQMFEEEGQKIAVLEAKVTDLRDRYKKVCNSLAEIKSGGNIDKKKENLQNLKNNAEELKMNLAQYEGLDNRWEQVRALLSSTEHDYREYLQNREQAQKEKNLAEELRKLNLEKGKMCQDVSRLHDLIENLRFDYQPEVLEVFRTERDMLKEGQGRLNAELALVNRELERFLKLITEKEKIKKEAQALEERIKEMEKAQYLLQQMRGVLNESGDKMAQVYRDFLGREADLLYQQVAKDNVHLSWGDDYEIIIKDTIDNKERERNFSQLSGGEKMTAALAVRLALLKYLSALGIGFFDEPTANLDDKRRTNLARIIPEITRNFRQVFVISHDDTFDAITENVIIIKKEVGKGSTVSP